MVISGISGPFGQLSRSPRQVTHVLLTRAPLYSTPRRACFSSDLHVLGTPPAFVLSQDQTLQLNCIILINVTRTSCYSVFKEQRKLFYATSRSSRVPFIPSPVKRKSFPLFPPPSMGEALPIYPSFFSVKCKFAKPKKPSSFGLLNGTRTAVCAPCPHGKSTPLCPRRPPKKINHRPARRALLSPSVHDHGLRFSPVHSQKDTCFA